jgi:hypothetical protein
MEIDREFFYCYMNHVFGVNKYKHDDGIKHFKVVPASFAIRI